jgi:hypothetical protein
LRRNSGRHSTKLFPDQFQKTDHMKTIARFESTRRERNAPSPAPLFSFDSPPSSLVS